MALSLVGDYGGSGSSEESEEESEEEHTKPPKPQVSLPSAADMFDSVEAGAASFMAAPVPSAEVPLTTPKRKKTGDAGSSNNSRGSSSSKKNKTSAGAEEAAASTAGEPSNCRRLIPPQMSRPNIVTEDSAMWSSDAEVKRRRQVEAERRGGAGKGKGGKDSLTFKQREKAKRDKGQASRGKSYVEEEKRLLRELGSS